MTEEWRNSEAQVIRRGRWTRLNGTDTEILIPHEGGASAGGASYSGSVGGAVGGGGAGGLAPDHPGGSSVGGGGASNGGGAGGSATDHLVLRVRRATSKGPSDE